MLTKKDIHQFLLSQGYTISYATVCSYIKNIESYKEKKKERSLYPGCSMSLDALPEFDWGEVLLFIDGVKQVYRRIHFPGIANGADTPTLFRHQNTLAFMESPPHLFQGYTRLVSPP